MSSYHSELTGILTAMLAVNKLCEFFAITSGVVVSIHQVYTLYVHKISK
jgi:hypothetical protein